MRPSKDQMFMAMALIAAKRSTCLRAQVGCIITNNDGTSIVSMGYNGNARGAIDGCDRPDAPGNCGCLHAEENALIKAPYDPQRSLILYTTMSPCLPCAKRILNSGVGKLFYGALYRDALGASFLTTYGIKPIRLDMEAPIEHV